MKFKVADLLSFKKKSVKPEPEVQYHVYSLPGFDNRQTPEFLMGEDIKSTKYSVQPKTILMNKLNVGFKRVWLIDQPLDNSIASTEFIPLSVSSKDELNLQYMYYFLTSRKVTEVLKKASTGTSNSHQRINADLIADLDIDLPSLREQKLIADKLAALDSKITLNQEINDNLFELSKILFEAVLEDDRSELTNLANLTDIQNGFAFKSKEYIGFSDTPIVRTLNIGADNLFDMQNLKYISDESRTKYKKFEFKTFDTALVMVGASIGKTGFVTSRTNGGLQNQNMWRFRPLNSEMPGLYIYNLVTYANSQMQGYKTGSAREFYTKDAFKNFEVPVGNADIYKAFFAIQDLLDNNASQTTTLTAMRDEILIQVMA